jgi:hypothetical protein
MPYIWRSMDEVDETIVVIRNQLDHGPTLPAWLVSTVNASIADSEKPYSDYFVREVKRWAPGTVRYFEEAIRLPKEWRSNYDVEEFVEVIKDFTDSEGEIPNWLAGTVNRIITESEPVKVRYFFEVLKRSSPASMKYFDEGVTAV